MRIVIAGQPKTGTTALYFRIKNSVPPDAWCLFEPKKYLRPPDDPRPQWVVAKVLIGRAYARGGPVGADGFSVDYGSFASFDRKLHILRDPRDNLVSSLLYAVRHTSFYADDRRLDQFLALLEEKERNPTDVSMLRLLDVMATLDRGVELLPAFLAARSWCDDSSPSTPSTTASRTRTSWTVRSGASRTTSGSRSPGAVGSTPTRA